MLRRKSAEDRKTEIIAAVLPVLAVAALALTVHAVAGSVLALISEVHQCGHIIVNNKNNVAAAPAGVTPAPWTTPSYPSTPRPRAPASPGSAWGSSR